MRKWVLSEVNYGFVKDNPYEVAVLPLGATEPHNLHLPYGMDTFEADIIGELACRLAWERGAKVVLLPTLPYGTHTNQLRFPFAMNLNPSTLTLVIRDLVESLEKHDVLKLLILNSHGGNDVKPVLRELYGRTKVHIFLCNWYREISADLREELFESAGDHAGEMETSMALAYLPDLVARDPETGRLLADDGAVRPTRFDAVNRGWVSMTRPWHLLTTNTGVGNPHPATAEKGRKFVETVAERLAEFLVELSQSPVDETFPY